MRISTSSLCLTVAGLVLALPGCGRKKAAAKAPDPMMVLPPEPATARGEANTAADLEALNKTLREYVKLKKVIPKDLNELVTSGFVRRLPAPPPGQKFTIMLHPLGYQVILVSE